MIDEQIMTLKFSTHMFTIICKTCFMITLLNNNSNKNTIFADWQAYDIFITAFTELQFSYDLLYINWSTLHDSTREYNKDTAYLKCNIIIEKCRHVFLIFHMYLIFKEINVIFVAINFNTKTVIELCLAFPRNSN